MAGRRCEKEQPRKYTVRMILSSGSAVEGNMAAALALGVPSVVALAAYGAVALQGERFANAARFALLAGWAAHALAIVVDIAGLGNQAVGARFGFAPALSVTLWLVLAVHGVESRFMPTSGIRRTLALLGMVAVVLAWRFPGELLAPSVSRWAPLHWVLGIASYGLFGVAVLHGVMLNRAEHQMRRKVAAVAVPPMGLPLMRLERLTFRFVAAGFAVLSAAIVLGAWFAHPWRWDHKTVLSMLGWVVFAGLLAGRHQFGWRGLRATRWLYAGAALLLLAYAGSRFVFEVLLHRAPPA
jgi:ABC-type uncharacterized transport system permease subunit